MNDFARDNELKTRGNRVGLWSLVKTSVLDQKRMCVCGALAHVRFGSKADMCSAKRHVRFTPKSGHPKLVDYLISKSTRNRVSCRISGIDEEPPLGMFDEKAKDRHGSHPLGIAEDVDLPLKCRSSLSPALLGSFQLRRACLNWCDVDHQSLQKRKTVLYCGRV